jgi:hypothetical protein
MTTRRALAVAATASVALSVAPAGAAQGQLILHRSGPTTVVSNPSRGCVSIAAGFSTVTNATDVAVTVHSGIGCRGSGQVIHPGDTVQVGTRRSVWMPS